MRSMQFVHHTEPRRHCETGTAAASADLWSGSAPPPLAAVAAAAAAYAAANTSSTLSLACSGSGMAACWLPCPWLDGLPYEALGLRGDEAWRPHAAIIEVESSSGSPVHVFAGVMLSCSSTLCARAAESGEPAPALASGVLVPRACNCLADSVAIGRRLGRASVGVPDGIVEPTALASTAAASTTLLPFMRRNPLSSPPPGSHSSASAPFVASMVPGNIFEVLPADVDAVGVPEVPASDGMGGKSTRACSASPNSKPTALASSQQEPPPSAMACASSASSS
mmetsp:Transcript_54559/g.127035  ORF Transcript_54559/g.127035 Transcript_54559/m.127035 type:complete len:281 (+) Transcript_54559:7-849(+)